MSAPGSGTPELYDVHVIDGKLHEGIWRGGKGYTRIIHKAHGVIVLDV